MSMATVPATLGTQAALAALQPGEVGASTLSQRAVDRLTGWLSRRTSRRGFLVRAGVLGSALAVDPTGYLLRPGTAYAAVCGPGASATGGWTVFCATINNGVNACPPGSIAAGWWKADGASLCGGKARYIIDCNATCSRCSSPGARAGICSSSCWSCSCEAGLPGTCDKRKVCCNAFRYGQCNQDVRQVGGVHCRVVSCAPPWTFEDCSTAPATDNRTRDHNSDKLPQAFTPITAHYLRLGDLGSALGATILGEIAVAGGRAQRYQRGRISASSPTGVRETVGPVAVRYESLRAESGPLGFPSTSPLTVPGGTASRFERGRISWSPATGAHSTQGPIAARYEQLGAEGGSLGFPLGEPEELRDGPFKRPGDPVKVRSEFEGGFLTYDERTGVVLLQPRTGVAPPVA